MEGYDREEALRYIEKSIDKRALTDLGPSLMGYLRQAQELDLRYMGACGAITPEGLSGDGYYDPDDAFEYILEEMVKMRGLGDEAAILVAGLIDAYMAAQDAYLEKEGLVE